MSTLKRVGVLWKKEKGKGKDKKTYLTGTLDFGVLGTARIAVFLNDKKEGDKNTPDANVVLFGQEAKGEPTTGQ